MANQSKLKLTSSRQVGGKNKTITRTWQNIKPEAENTVLVTLGTALGTLIADDFVSLSRIDETNLQ